MAESKVILDVMTGGSSVAVHDIGGTSHQAVKVEFGDVNTATPVSSANPLPVSGINGTITNGSIVVTAGTVGTVSAIGQVHNAGTIAGGTLNILTDGTIDLKGAVALSDAVANPTVARMGVFPNLWNSVTSDWDRQQIIRHGLNTAGDGIAAVGMLVEFDDTIPSSITENQFAALRASSRREAYVQIRDAAGSEIGLKVNANGNLDIGTVTHIGKVYNAGTIAGGTIGILTDGTIRVVAGTTRDDGRSARNILSFGTTIAFGSSAFATLVGSAAIGAGTSLWVNDLSIVNHGGTVQAGIVFGSATNGSAVLAKGQFSAQGGIEKPFPKAVNAGITNTDLNAWVDGASTVTFNVSYFISA